MPPFQDSHLLSTRIVGEFVMYVNTLEIIMLQPSSLVLVVLFN